MNQERMMMVLREPYVSEKSTILADKRNQIAFKVLSDASKPEIKEAVEQLFKVKVDSVSTVTVHGKNKRFRNRVGRRSDWKKAYVTLAQGQDINFGLAE